MIIIIIIIIIRIGIGTVRYIKAECARLYVNTMIIEESGDGSDGFHKIDLTI